MTGTTGEPAVLRLAVIDADTGFLTVLARRLAAVGWQHRVLGSAVRTEELVAMRLNALLVDLGVLGPAGWEYLEAVCRELPELGVIVCSGPSTVAQRVRALRLGADDWIGKPCHPEEVVARIEAVVRRRRRSRAGAESDALMAGDVEIRADQFQAFVDGRSIDLTRREFELIRLLAGMAGQVIEREEIYQRVWGYAMAHGDRSVDVFVRKLRQKLERHSPGWRYIHTHFGIGYRFAAEPIGSVGVVEPPRPAAARPPAGAPAREVEARAAPADAPVGAGLRL
ncbi:MAG: response regulator transcription factor [Actinobacteria bacterium]|nr:MAG: response regulator transcription factor [Actinomycetota bacterium]